MSCFRQSTRWNSLGRLHDARHFQAILFAALCSGNFKFPASRSGALGVLMTGPVGALISLSSLNRTAASFSVSSGLGLLALMGVSVETAT